jgi:hypothetical protein
MNIQLIDGQFSNAEATGLVSEFIQVKIKFHEQRIIDSENAEDVKMRESKIKQLQNQLHEFRKQAREANGKVNLNGNIQID